jgi:adenine phosphoribosyltransferase
LTAHRETYRVEIAGLQRELPLFEVAPGERIAVLNILGDTELVQASARALSEKLAVYEYDILVTAEAKSIPLAHALSVQTEQPYVVLRKVYKPYMGVALSA